MDVLTSGECLMDSRKPTASTMRATITPEARQYSREIAHEVIGSRASVTLTWGRYHGGRRPSSDDSFHTPTVIPPLALDKPSIRKRYHRRRTTRWGVTARSPTMATLHDGQFVECRWWNEGWAVKTVVT